MTERPGTTGGANPLLVEGVPEEIASGVYVIPDRRINLVPNIGIVLGDESVLVVDTAMGPANGTLVRKHARRLGGSRRTYLTITHFHPEHGFGAQCFRDDAHILYNRSQAYELAESGEEFIELFKGFGPDVAEMLEGVELVQPHETYDRRFELDLGGRLVELLDVGGAHTLGDQIVLLRADGVLFAGDLVENRFFPIVFGDVADAPAWIDTLARLAELGASTVVPGHGEVGGPELIEQQRAYLVHVRDEVAVRQARGEDADTVTAALEPQIRRAYETWDNPEWIEFAIRNFHRRGVDQQA